MVIGLIERITGTTLANWQREPLKADKQLQEKELVDGKSVHVPPF